MCHVSCVMCYMSRVTSRMSHVTSHLSLTPTVTATDPPPASSPTMHIGLVCKDPKTKTSSSLGADSVKIQPVPVDLDIFLPKCLCLRCSTLLSRWLGPRALHLHHRRVRHQERRGHRHNRRLRRLQRPLRHRGLCLRLGQGNN